MRGTAVAALLLFLAGPALAQGGRYVGPVEGIPPDLRRPSDWPPPDGGGYGRGAPVTFESWRFAWHLRENGIVEARAAKVRHGVSARTVEEVILPALRAAAATDVDGRDQPEAALLGLARVGDEPSLDLLRATARDADENRRGRRAQQCGVLALGLVGENAPILRVIAQDPEAFTVPRAFACVALGVLERGRPSLDTFRVLEARLFDETSPEIPSAAAFGLGHLGTAESAGILLRRLAAPPPRGRWEWDGPVLGAHVAAALGRAAGASGDAGAAEDAFRVLESCALRGGELPAQGAILGLGSLGIGAPAGISKRCVRVLTSEFRDPQARRFAALALARVAAEGPAPARDMAMHSLVRSLVDARPTPSWAALAAALAGEGRTIEERTALARGVRRLWDAPSPEGIRPVEDRGGCLVALGILRDPSARPLLEEILADAGEDVDLREYAAAALGLLGDPAAIPALRGVLADRSGRRWRRSVVVSLGLLGDVESVPAILDVLLDPKSRESVLGGCAQALGFLRDETSVEPLLACVADSDRPDLTRAYALTALSRMAVGSRPDPFAELTADVPYRAYTWPMVELWSIL